MLRARWYAPEDRIQSPPKPLGADRRIWGGGDDRRESAGLLSTMISTVPHTNDKHLLITAGPTQEPIDEVRFVSNRSSGRLGVEIAHAADELGWSVTLLLGPGAMQPADTRIRVIRFRTAADLEGLLDAQFPVCLALVMAAAVADFRPKNPTPGAKIRRRDQSLTIELEPVPDLLARCAGNRKPDQVLVGFALEPGDRLSESAQDKLRRKGVDAIVANPLETMDSGAIEATLLSASGEGVRSEHWPRSSKGEFATRLMKRIEKWIEERA